MQPSHLDPAFAEFAQHHPIQIAPRLWWVGHYLPDDPFQCHAYLLEQGDQSVLFDPGSALTVAHTLSKVEQVLPFSSIRYFVCHHQDPDITGALPQLDHLVSREDACLVTHWRARVLLRHLDLRRMTFWNVEEHGWELELEDRTLKFIFTPYAHFPGAFCTFDQASGTLLSSDLFGGFTEGFNLYATDEQYFDSMRPFHEHYIPSREIMQFVLDRIAEVPVVQIAPQHGSIITGDLVPYVVSRLRQLDCGLYLLAHTDTNVLRLSRLNQMLRELTASLLKHRDFKATASELTGIVGQVVPLAGMEFWISTDGAEYLQLAPELRYRAAQAEPPAQVSQCLAEAAPAHVSTLTFGPHAGLPGLLICLPMSDGSAARAVAVFRLTDGEFQLAPVRDALERIAPVLAVAVEREAIYRTIDMERQRIYEDSVRDTLTGLHTRRYLEELYPQWASAHDRHEARPVSLLMLDLDHFKLVNDRYGHVGGDRVLAAVGGAVLSAIRSHDVAVRFGGEEIAVFLLQEDVASAQLVAERIRRAISELRFDGALEPLRVTVSAGVAARTRGEALTELVRRADTALYEAKRAGRGRVCVAG